MVMSRDVMAQAVYLAQLEAAKDNCKCRACRILRKATTMMADEFLKSKGSKATSSLSEEVELVDIEEEE